MRGRTLNDAFVILDEAHTTSEQMKMFLTRLGFDRRRDHRRHHADRPAARAHIGPDRGDEGGVKIDGILFVHFDERDVVRHKSQQIEGLRRIDNGSNGKAAGLSLRVSVGAVARRLRRRGGRWLARSAPDRHAER